MNFEEKKLHQILINLTKGFSYNDSITYRKDRNWIKFDLLTSVEKLKYILKEVQEYKQGYFKNNLEY